MTNENSSTVLQNVKAEANALNELPPEARALPQETQVMLSVMAGFFRSSSGPDPETAKIIVQAEMHEESCKLEGFQKALTSRDLQNARDHEFRTKKLNHETLKGMVITVMAVAGIICSLYLIVVRKDTTVGTPLLVASFLSLGVKMPGQRDKD